MDSTKKNARVAGLLYLSFGPAVFNLIHVLCTLIARGNATATANREQSARGESISPK